MVSVQGLGFRGLRLMGIESSVKGLGCRELSAVVGTGGRVLET